LVKLKIDQFSEEWKTNCTWLKLLVVEFHVFHNLIGGQKKRTIWNQTFLQSKSGEESEKPPWLCVQPTGKWIEHVGQSEGALR